jgi:precorrin-8X/cobalt-precorrin-8 methylmutase
MNYGSRIEEESFRIIEGEMGEHPFGPLEFPLVRRVIHATADFEIGGSLVFSEGAVQAGMQLVSRGAPLFTDIRMVASGISKVILKEAGGGEVFCRIDDPKVTAQAQAQASGTTRAAAAIRAFRERIPESIVVIGNAPTALREVLRLHHEEGVRPALVVAVPVGFVDAAESKEALMQTDLTFMTNRGRKGGTPVAVAMVNALLRMTKGGMPRIK